MTYTNKTQPTAVSPEDFLKNNFDKDVAVKAEALSLIDTYTKATGWPCVMWNKIFGFGKYHYSDSKGGDHFYLVTGFAISKTGFTIYNMMGWEKYKSEIEKLGKYKLSGKSCLAIKSCKDINLEVLQKIIKQSVADLQKKYKVD